MKELTSWRACNKGSSEDEAAVPGPKSMEERVCQGADPRVSRPNTADLAATRVSKAESCNCSFPKMVAEEKRSKGPDRTEDERCRWTTQEN